MTKYEFTNNQELETIYSKLEGVDMDLIDMTCTGRDKGYVIVYK